MDEWILRVSNKPVSNAMKQDMIALLSLKEDYSEYVAWLATNTVTLGQISMLAYVLNDGLVVTTNSDSDSTEAIHMQNPISQTELTELYNTCKQSLSTDLKNFEQELEALTLEPTGHGDAQ